jgi:Chaperone of endosialidase
MPPFFASFRVFRAQTSDLLRIIHVNESRFQIRLIRVIRGLKKIQSFRKIFGNFVPNFREQIANGKHPNTKNQKPKIQRTTTMKQMLLGTSPNHMKRKLSEVTMALLGTYCFALSPTAAHASNPHGSPTPTPTPTPTITPSPTPTPTPVGDLGNGNTAIGNGSLLSLTTGTYNAAMGYQALSSNTTGSGNTASGAFVLSHNTAGHDNTAVGYQALYNNATGNWNTALGEFALAANSTGNLNTANGYFALWQNSIGQENVALGYLAGGNLHTGSYNIYIGSFMTGEDGETGVCYIGSIFGQTSSGGTPVYINSAGKLGTTTSSRRFKEDIKLMNDASEALFALKPVTFRYKKEIDPKGLPQFGLVAEDVEKVNPDLVVRDKEGKVNTVRYEQINAMLLNEFLKEHKRVEEQEVTISDLKKDLGVLTAQLKEQAAEIQKVSAQLEMRRPLTRVARSYP